MKKDKTDSKLVEYYVRVLNQLLPKTLTNDSLSVKEIDSSFYDEIWDIQVEAGREGIGIRYKIKEYVVCFVVYNFDTREYIKWELIFNPIFNNNISSLDYSKDDEINNLLTDEVKSIQLNLSQNYYNWKITAYENNKFIKEMEEGLLWWEIENSLSYLIWDIFVKDNKLNSNEIVDHSLIKSLFSLHIEDYHNQDLFVLTEQENGNFKLTVNGYPNHYILIEKTNLIKDL